MTQDSPLGREAYLSAFRFEASSMSAPAPPPGPLRRASTTSRTANGEKKVITRNRASYSCHNCRRRKIKCDKIHPICGGCRKTNERCIYNTNPQDGSSAPTSAYTESSPEESRHGAKRRKGSNDSESEEISPESSEDIPEGARKESIVDRLDRLTSLVEALSKNKEPEEASPPVPQFGIRQESISGPAKRRDSIKYSNGETPDTEFLGPIPSKHQLSSSRGPSRSPEFDVPTGEATELADPMSKMNLGYMSVQEGGRTRYVGSTFWAYVSDEIEQLNGLLRNQNRYNVALSAREEEDSPCCKGEEQADSPMSDTSDDSQHHNSFHRAGDHNHHQKAQFRSDCDACERSYMDKSVLLQTLESHPSRFRRMDSDMVTGIPTKTQSHILFRCWLSGVHGHIPLIYPPLALKKYEMFWDWYEKDKNYGKPLPEAAFLPLLYTVYYAGSVSISLRGLRTWFPGTTRAKLSAGFHDQVTRCLANLAFPRNASAPALAAFLMTQMILAKEEEPMTGSLYVSLAIRVAQTLGLHREPTLFNFPAWEVETRRRIWWQIVHNDCSIAVASGLPPLISDSYFDTKMISEVKDVKLGTPEANAYQEAIEAGTRPRDNPDDPINRDRKSMVSIHYVFARGKYVLARGIRRLLKIHLGTKPITKGDMREMRTILSEVDHDLNEIIDRIPTKGIPEMGFTPERDPDGRYLLSADYDPALAQQPTEEELRPFSGLTPKEGLNEVTIRYHWNTLIAYHKWARIVLSLSIDKMYCVFYAPFLKNARSKFWPAARQCALRHCHGYMRKFISLATDPAFQPFQWSWPGMHQPMHAAMIMLVDLYERPNSVEAPRSRAFIDKIFSMSGPDGGIVSGEDGVTVQRPLREGGREAWDMLRRLREKAWQKAELDPDVLWTEEDQIKAGVATPLTDAQRIVQSIREDTFHNSGVGSNAGIKAGENINCASATEMMNTAIKEPNPPDLNQVETEAVLNPNARPQTLRRAPTSQEKTPFRSTAARQAKISNAAADANKFFNPQFSGLSYSASAADRILDPSNPAPLPVPSMAPPATRTGYFNPPTAMSGGADSGGSPSNTNSVDTPLLAAAPGPTLAGAPGPPPAYSTSLPNPLAQSQPQKPQSQQPNGEQRGAPNQGQNGGEHEHFDWDQWDAVFGPQHNLGMGFEDMMEGVDSNWEGQNEDDGDQRESGLGLDPMVEMDDVQ